MVERTGTFGEMVSMNEKPTIRTTCPRCKRSSFKVEIGILAICPVCKHRFMPTEPYAEDTMFNRRHHEDANKVYNLVWAEPDTKRDLGALDKDRGIDVKLTLKSGLTLDIQEKFRRAEYRDFWQFTIEYKNNPRTDEPGEFFKLAANYYFYSYVSQDESEFTDWWIVDLNRFKQAFTTGEIVPDEIVPNKERSNASFMCFDWEHIENINGMIFRCEHEPPPRRKVKAQKAAPDTRKSVIKSTQLNLFEEPQ